MKYRNTKNGSIIESDCVISGGFWVPADGVSAAPVKAKAEKTPVKAPEPALYDDDDDSDLEIAPVQQKAKGKKK